MNVRLLSKDEILETPTVGGRRDTLRAEYSTVRKVVEKLPGFDKGFFINPKSGGEEDADFPDDDYKVDVTFGLKDENTDAIIVLWNYKNGPAYIPNEGLTLNDIKEFSVCFVGDEKATKALLSDFYAACNAVK